MKENRKRLPLRLMGAVIGDIAGSLYEFDNIYTTDFELLSPRAFFTDDTVMTAAVAEAFVRSRTDGTPLFRELTECMQTFGRQYPGRGYGGRFAFWLQDPCPQPYNSWGNGAPMRCAAAGWVTDDPQEAYRLGGETAAPSHNHPEGMEAAGVTACMICAARGGADRESLRAYAAAHYEIPTIAELEGYEFTEASRLTMPAVFAAFFESTDFEDCIRRAVAIGGDSDTIAAIAGSIAEAFYGIPQELIAQACDFLPDHLQETLLRFEDTFAL